MDVFKWTHYDETFFEETQTIEREDGTKTDIILPRNYLDLDVEYNKLVNKKYLAIENFTDEVLRDYEEFIEPEDPKATPQKEPKFKNNVDRNAAEEILDIKDEAKIEIMNYCYVNGINISDTEHQNEKYGCPVIKYTKPNENDSNYYIMRFSCKEWSEIMATVWSKIVKDRKADGEDISYLEWYNNYLFSKTAKDLRKAGSNQLVLNRMPDADVELAPLDENTKQTLYVFE